MTVAGISGLGSHVGLSSLGAHRPAGNQRPLFTGSVQHSFGMSQGTASSSLARRFEDLQDRAQRKPTHSTVLDMPGDASRKASIGHLKEFYLQRLSKTEPSAASRLSAKLGGADSAKPQANGRAVARPTFTREAMRDIEDLEIMCNNCFSLIKSSEAGNCTGKPSECSLAKRAGNSQNTTRPSGAAGLIDMKLAKLRAALESRLTDTGSKVNVMRHLTQLRYHVDTALKWTVGGSEIGALSDHTVQQVRQLTATSRVLAPAVYVFSKRIENAVVQKERELRRAMTQQVAQPGRVGAPACDNDWDDRDGCDTLVDSVVDVRSVVSEMDSDCGTQYAETVVTQDGPGQSDVGNMQDANDYLMLKSEDEQRRWFYSQCLTAKLACADKAKARKILISDLYAKVRASGLPMDQWVKWIKEQLSPNPE